MSYPAPPPASPPPSPSPDAASPLGGFVNDLFDVRFTRFVSLRLISIVYVLYLVTATVIGLIAIALAFAAELTTGLITLVVVILMWLISVIGVRVALEAFAVLFRIHDDTSRAADTLGGSRGTGPGYDAGGSTYGASRSHGSQAYGATPGTTGSGTTTSGAVPGAASGSTSADPSRPPWS
jgi:Domain of unknown function (DUF4282)